MELIAGGVARTTPNGTSIDGLFYRQLIATIYPGRIALIPIMLRQHSLWGDPPVRDSYLPNSSGFPLGRVSGTRLCSMKPSLGRFLS